MAKKVSASVSGKLEMLKGIELATKAQQAVTSLYKKEKHINPFEPKYLSVHCDEILYNLVTTEYELYKVEEKRAHIDPLWLLFKGKIPNNAKLTEKEIEILVRERFDDLRDFFLSISQSRKSRAGGSFQYHIDHILTTLNYPHDSQKIIDGKPDFILPKAELYHKNPGECILITAKRTLRERWREVITEGKKSPHYFLMTVDTKPSQNLMQEMADNRISLVVPSPIIAQIPAYKKFSNVITFKGLLDDYVAPAMKRWKQKGIIKK